MFVIGSMDLNPKNLLNIFGIFYKPDFIHHQINHFLSNKSNYHQLKSKFQEISQKNK